MYEKWDRQISLLEQGTCEYEWDELEELITDSFEEEEISSDEFDELMTKLMEIE